MAGENKIIERLINFNAYDETGEFLGVTSVDLPELESMTETTSGAGIAGEVESPLLGHYGSLVTTFKWRSITLAAMKLSQQRAHLVDLRGSQQVYDAAMGIYQTMPVRATMKIVPKNVSLGTFEPNATTDTEQEFEVLYLKLRVDKRVAVEIDKYNFKAVINGYDALASVRSDLGLN